MYTSRPVACILQSIKCESIYSRNFDEIAIKKFLRNDPIRELIIVSLSYQDCGIFQSLREFCIEIP